MKISPIFGHCDNRDIYLRLNHLGHSMSSIYIDSRIPMALVGFSLNIDAHCDVVCFDSGVQRGSIDRVSVVDLCYH